MSKSCERLGQACHLGGSIQRVNIDACRCLEPEQQGGRGALQRNWIFPVPGKSRRQLLNLRDHFCASEWLSHAIGAPNA
jgi:hypothetical protein